MTRATRASLLLVLALLAGLFATVSQPSAPPASAAEGSSVEDDATLALLRRALDRVQRTVAPATWQAFWQTAVEGRPAVDVAEGLGLTAGAVRVARCRALQRLRCELGEVDEQPPPSE